MKTRTLIIGYGSPLRGDDRLGWEVVRLLGDTLEDESVEILALHQLAPELAEPISQAETVIFVDASHGGLPGTWKCEALDPGTLHGAALAHHCTPAGLLLYAQAIFRSSPRAMVVSVAAGSFECAENLTPAVAAALPEVVSHIRTQISHPQEEPSHA